MVDEYAAQGEIAEGELHRGVGLEFHALVQAVEVHAGYHGAFLFVGRFLFHDGSEGIDFVGGKPGCLCLSLALGGPVCVVFLLHAAQEFFGSDVPVHLVRVGDEQARGGRRVHAETLQQNCVAEDSGERGGVGVKLRRESSGKVVHRMHHGDDELYRGLPSAPQVAHKSERAYAAARGVTPLVNVGFVVEQ